MDKTGSKNPSFVTGGDKSQLTVLACCSAAGYAIPPFVIFDRQSLNQGMTKGEVPGTLYGLDGSTVSFFITGLSIIFCNMHHHHGHCFCF